MGDGYVEPNCGSARNTLLMSLAELTGTLSFRHPQRWRTAYFQEFPRHVHLCHFPNDMLIPYSSGS